MFNVLHMLCTGIVRFIISVAAYTLIRPAPGPPLLPTGTSGAAVARTDCSENAPQKPPPLCPA